MNQTGEQGPVIVLTTLAAEADAKSFCRVLVEERLAACVNVLAPTTSIYTWKGRVEEEREQQLVIKTTRDRVPALEARIRQLHSYEVPEILVVGVEGGSQAYLAWLDQSTRPV